MVSLTDGCCSLASPFLCLLLCRAGARVPLLWALGCSSYLILYGFGAPSEAYPVLAQCSLGMPLVLRTCTQSSCPPRRTAPSFSFVLISLTLCLFVYEFNKLFVLLTVGSLCFPSAHTMCLCVCVCVLCVCCVCIWCAMSL